MPLAEPLRVTLLLTEVLTTLKVPYLVGGSIASSLHGIPRATQDVDLVAALTESHVETFAGLLEATFYLDRDTIRDAIRRRASFNIIHLQTMLKLDPHQENALRLCAPLRLLRNKSLEQAPD